ncbi:Putative serine protease HhoA [Fundidesulfovibrio magnetotacticus]|uniref:Serine protease HhoA n=1 Tax=Fundidesulfovibrio magnetotacticus TaxID=2730080 RepID=A0A6V8LRM5_9BACT|nr:trypsin-like peptidase domain-containing protein [Fundidesulfovibrio magnetotacticus]GFK92247.1 Putative serine protease HhoA [Fundidesulfovibrio magnetotacticus]
MRHLLFAAFLSAASIGLSPNIASSAQPAPPGSVTVSRQALPSVVGIAANLSEERPRSRGGQDQEKDQALKRFFEEFGDSFPEERDLFARKAKPQAPEGKNSPQAPEGMNSPQAKPGKVDPKDLRVFGSGFFVADTNLVVTAAHVAGEFKRLYVVTQDQTVLPAAVAVFDERTDLAVLRVETDKAFRGLALGDSLDIEVGEPVLAMGNPFGFTFTVTSGIVSAKGRRLDQNGPGMIQTDAPLNPGNSGGPIVDMQGQVVGVSHAIRSAARKGEQGFSIGLGFAVPVEQVKEILKKAR